jgi:hypothetical protein
VKIPYHFIHFVHLEATFVILNHIARCPEFVKRDKSLGGWEQITVEKSLLLELSRPKICHLVGEICADKSLKLLKKQLNGNFYSFTGH